MTTQQEFQLRKEAAQRGYNPQQINQFIEFAKQRERQPQSKPSADTPQQQSGGGFMSRLKQSASAGINQIKEGAKQISNHRSINPIPVLEGALKVSAGAVNTAFSPVTAAAEPVTKPTIGRAVEYAADKISDNPSFQEFANSKAGNIASRVTEDINNLNTIAGAVVGGKTAGKVGTVAKQSIESGTAKLSTKTANVAKKTSSALDDAGDLAVTAALGDDFKAAVSKFADNPETVNAFRSGAKTYESVAKNVTKAANQFQKSSYETFQKMKQGLPDARVPNSNLVGEAKKIIADAPPLLPNEQTIVNKALDLIRGNKNQTLKGILDLRNRLDRGGFIREGDEFINSNRVIRNLRTKLNEMAVTRAKNYDAKYKTNYAERIMEGLSKSSKDIEFLELLQTNVIGVNNFKYLERTATKLKQIMNKLDDPAEFEATKNLLKELEARTGINVIDDLDFARVAKIIDEKLKMPGATNITGSLGALLNKGIIKAVDSFSK